MLNKPLCVLFIVIILLITAVNLGLHFKFGYSSEENITETITDKIHSNVNSSDIGNVTTVHVNSTTVACLVLAITGIILSLVSLIATIRLFHRFTGTRTEAVTSPTNIGQSEAQLSVSNYNSQQLPMNPPLQYNPYAVQFQNLPLKYTPHKVSPAPPPLPPTTHVSSPPQSVTSMCSASSNYPPTSCAKMNT